MYMYNIHALNFAHLTSVNTLMKKAQYTQQSIRTVKITEEQHLAGLVLNVGPNFVTLQISSSQLSGTFRGDVKEIYISFYIGIGFHGGSHS